MSMDTPHLDEAGSPASSPGSHGHTALLLVEALIHGLLERSILQAEDAIEIVETALDVSAAVAEDRHATNGPAPSATAYLELMRSSLRTYG